MTTQPEALRLASELTDDIPGCPGLDDLNVKAAAELRRLHELALEQQGKIYALEMARSMEQKTAKLKQDALLEALDQCLNGTLIGGHTHNDNGLEVLAERCGSPHVAAELRRLAGIARAAIKALEGENHAKSL